MISERAVQYLYDKIDLLERQVAASQEREVKLREAIMRAQLGSCSCVTKTNDPQYHKSYCGYRILSEALTLPADDTAMEVPA